MAGRQGIKIPLGRGGCYISHHPGQACEGIVAKHKDSPYLSENTISTWYEIRNPRYSQMVGRHELFERERHSEPVGVEKVGNADLLIGSVVALTRIFLLHERSDVPHQ
jgi:hypothetical protein